MQEKEMIDHNQSKCSNKRCFYTYIHLTITSILALVLIYFGLQFFIPKTSKLNKIYINQTLAAPLGAKVVNNQVDTVLVIYDLSDVDNLQQGQNIVLKIRGAREYFYWVFEYVGEDSEDLLIFNESKGTIEPHPKENFIGVFQKNANFLHKMYYMATLWFGYILLFLFIASIYVLSRVFVLQPLENKIKEKAPVLKDEDLEKIVEERIKKMGILVKETHEKKVIKIKIQKRRKFVKLLINQK